MTRERLKEEEEPRKQMGRKKSEQRSSLIPTSKNVQVKATSVFVFDDVDGGVERLSGKVFLPPSPRNASSPRFIHHFCPLSARELQIHALFPLLR